MGSTVCRCFGSSKLAPATAPFPNGRWRGAGGPTRAATSRGSWSRDGLIRWTLLGSPSKRRGVFVRLLIVVEARLRTTCDLGEVFRAYCPGSVINSGTWYQVQTKGTTGSINALFLNSRLACRVPSGPWVAQPLVPPCPVPLASTPATRSEHRAPSAGHAPGPAGHLRSL